MSGRSPLPYEIGFNAQHSPAGAFMSFTCGNFGSRGGIGLQIGQPSDQNLFVGVKDGDRYCDKPLQCFPFCTGFENRAADAFLVEQAGPSEQNVRPNAVPIDRQQIQRYYGWCTDEWRADAVRFTVYSPFGSIPEPTVASPQKMREGLLPAVVARLVVDNTQGQQTKTGFFALGFARNGTRVLEADLGRPGRVAFAFRHEAGVAAELVDLDAPRQARANGDLAPFVFMRWSPSDGVQERLNPVHLLGSCPGIGFEVPPGKRYALVIAIGSYLGNVETTRLEGRYLYTRYYKDLTDVLSAALDRADDLVAEAESRDRQLETSPLSPEQRFIVAHSTHSYYGSTQLLDVKGEPIWIVNEGEYCMMNTLDLSIDQVFWELEHNPWVVRNLLDTFVSKYSYVDEVKVDAAGKERRPGGISFCHDMGAHNNFSPQGRSSYELANHTGCFSYMTQEQLCNWVLLAACYVAKTRDSAWLTKNREIIQACQRSMVARGGEAGFAQYDTARTEGGQEVTTYDSLDHSLAQARNNVYIAVKCWATYRALGLMFRDLGVKGAQTEAEGLASRVAAVVARQAVDGILPAIFEKSSPGHTSRILPAVEGCVYPLYFVQTGFAGQTLEQIFGSPNERQMFDVLKEHTRRLLLDEGRSNLFPDGGIKLSSTSNNSWMSKIAIFMHVARRVFRLDSDAKIAQTLQAADAAHVKWQTQGSAYWACSDQIVSGKAQASRYYPRIVSSALWLMGQ